MTTIWIVVPVYNVEKLLPKCIRSIQRQTYTDWKLVLVDDGSSDNSGRVCDKYAAKDHRISVTHTENGGAAVARQIGLDMVPESDYCCFCDSDDELPKDALLRLYQAAEATNADLICGQMRRIFHGFRIMPRYQMPCFSEAKEYSKPETMEKLYIGCFGISCFPMSLCGKLFRAETLKQAQENITVSPKAFAEDLNLTMHILPLCNKVTIIQDVVYEYRLGGGTSKFMPTFLDDNLLMYHQKMVACQQYTGELNLPRYIAIELKNIVFTYLTMCEQYNKYPKGDLLSEIAYVRESAEIADAFTHLYEKDINRGAYEKSLFEKDYGTVAALVRDHVRRNHWKQIVKKLVPF